MARVHVILVNWNGWRDTIECLESLLRLADRDFAITVCDNGSTDSSIDRILAWLHGGERLVSLRDAVWKNLHPERQQAATFQVAGPDKVEARSGAPLITVIDTGRNLGFAGGNNAGIRRALADPDCAYIWLLNNDTVVASQALAALCRTMDDEPDLAVCGSTLLFYHAPGTVQGLGGWFGRFVARAAHIGHMTAVNALPPRAEVEGQMAYVMGASMFVRRAVFERTGGLSEDYFLYMEELDLAARLLPGERQGWAPGSVVFHKEGGSIGSRSQGRASDLSLYHLQVSTLRFYRKFHPWLLPVALARAARDAWGWRRRGDKAAVEIGWIALIDFLAGTRRQAPLRRQRGEVS